MFKKTPLVAAFASLLAAIATSASAQVYGDTARVIAATPIYDQVATPRRECTVEPSGYGQPAIPPSPSRTRAETSGAGAVLGAIIGGVIGHQFGSSSGGRDHGTAAGAIIGGLVGNSIEKDANSGIEPAAQVVTVPGAPANPERCETVTENIERIVGYDVRYEYNGHEFRTRMPYDPGPQMPVNVEVRPPAPRDSAVGPRPPRYRGTY
jgi:uncharacterized protein YcfJ